MGKGIALQFKTAYPDNYHAYRKACKNGEVTVGKMFVTEDADLLGSGKIIINFPTKTTWRKPSEYSYIESGLEALKQEISDRQIKSIAIPPLGSRNGGLDWNKVKKMMVASLSDIDCEVTIYEPTDVIEEKLNEEKVRLTPARAMLLDVLCDLIANGEFASEFAAEKVVYFLQRFGGEDVFNVKFVRAMYGPYSGKVRYVLRYLNGSYVMGLSALQQKAFDEIWILPGTDKDAADFLRQPGNERYRDLAEKVKLFLRGYYSNYTLELLSTVDFLLMTDGSLKGWLKEDDIDVDARLIDDISDWNERKKRMFNNPVHVRMMTEHLRNWNRKGLLGFD